MSEQAEYERLAVEAHERAERAISLLLNAQHKCRDLEAENKRLREALEKVSEMIDSETPDVWYSADIAMVLAALAAPAQETETTE